MRVYFEQQILALLLVFHQTHNLSNKKFARALANQPISGPHFFNPQHMFLLRVKLIKQCERRELQRNNVARQVGFVSRISSPLRKPRRQQQRERHETKALMSRTIAVHVRYNSWYISKPSSAKQQREMTKFCVVWRT